MALLRGVATTIMEYNSRDKEVFERVKVIGDGHCLFRAMSMALWGTQHRHAEVRTSIVNHVVTNWQHYYERIQYTLGEEFNSPLKYANLMGNVQKRIYGSEFEITVFCEVYKRNATVYRERDVKQRICGKDTIFKVANFNINQVYTTYDFVFQGIEKGHESEGHYDLLIKRDLFELEVSDEPHKSNTRHDTTIHKSGIAENSYISSDQPKNVEKTPLQSLQLKEKSMTSSTYPDVLEKLIAFLNKKGCCNQKLKKRSKERHALFKEAALLIFGDCSNKHMLLLNKLYEKNFSKFITKVTAEKDIQQSPRNKVNEKYAELLNSVLNTLGDEITKEELMEKEKIVYHKVYNHYCQKVGWKGSNKNNARKFKHVWNKFLTQLPESDIGIKQITGKGETFADRLKDSRGCVKSLTYCKSPSHQDLQTSTKTEIFINNTIHSTVILWENECKKDQRFEHLVKEFISCHRRVGGVCTWTDFDDMYKYKENLKQIRSIKKPVILVFKKCLYKFCDNEMIIHLSTVGDELKIEIRESERGSDNYDICGHYQYYDDKKYPFDRMDEILYRDRIWMSVFDSSKDVYSEYVTNETDNMNKEILHQKGKINVSANCSNNEEYLKKNIENIAEKSGKSYIAVPKRKHSLSCSNKFAVEEKRVTGHIDDVMVNGVFDTATFRIWLRNAVIKQANISCRLIFTNSRLRHNENLKYVTYARCGSSAAGKCKEFKFEVEITDIVDVRITSSGTSVPIHTGKKRSYQLRGGERKIYKKKLLLDQAKTVQNEDMKHINIDAAIDLNMQSVRTLMTLRKCRSEAFKEDDLHSNDLLDLILLAKTESVSSTEEEKYIRKVVASPFQVYMFTGLQRKVIASKNVPAGYFDATGSVARQVVLSNNKPILYYALVVNVNGEILPVIEMLSEVHDISALADLFTTYKYFCLKSSKQHWPLIKRIVCDWSWAMMIGIVISWNSMDLLQYLRMCYNIVTDRSDPQQYRAKITIHACCAHFMKMVSDRLSKENILNKRVKEMILKVMGLLVICNSVSETDEIYTMLATISLSEKNYSITKHEIDKVNQILENKDLVISKSDIPQNSNLNDIDNEYVSGKTKLDSPFFTRYCSILQIVTDKLHTIRKNEPATEELNIYYCPGFFDYVHNHLMPLLPFWSGLMLFMHGSEEFNRLSNANVENYFQQVKHRLLKSKTNLKIGRLIKLLKSNVQSSLKNISIDISDYNKERKQRVRQKNNFCDIETKVILNPMEPKTVQTTFEQPCQISNEFHSEDIEDVDDPSITETWQKKRRSTSTYHLTTNKPLRNSKLFTKQTCSAGFENADKPTVDEPPENEEKYITIDRGLPSENEHSTRKEIGSVGEDNNRKFRVSMSKQYPHVCAIPNGLFMNPDFYLYEENELETDTYVVAFFKNLVPTKKLYLFGDAYFTLNGSRELHQNVIDCAIVALIKKLCKTDNVKFVNTETCGTLFKHNSVTAASPVWYYFRNLNEYDKILMPYIVSNKNHYCVLVGDIQNHTCFFYNPLPRYPDNCEVGFKKFRTFLSGLQKTQYKNDGMKVDRWTYVKGEGAVQSDSFNCGIYVINYIECFLKDQKMPTKINPTDYREYLKREILQWSDNMADICLQCGKGETRCKIWIMCDSCKRWAHFKPCLKYLSKTQHEVEVNDFIFICKLCQQFKSKYNRNPWE